MPRGVALTLRAFLLAGDTSAEAWVRTLLQEGLPAQSYGRLLLRPGSVAPADVAVAGRGRQVCGCFDVTDTRHRGRRCGPLPATTNSGWPRCSANCSAAPVAGPACRSCGGCCRTIRRSRRRALRYDGSTQVNAGGMPARQTCVLVGAGPGDPDLLTIKAVKALRRATVVLVDDLVDRRVLRWVRRSARIIEVGKRGGCRSTPQAFIEKLMVREVRRGERVVRLKGGDPLILGRAGEEIAALSRCRHRGRGGQRHYRRPCGRGRPGVVADPSRLRPGRHVRDRARPRGCGDRLDRDRRRRTKRRHAGDLYGGRAACPDPGAPAGLAARGHPGGPGGTRQPGRRASGHRRARGIGQRSRRSTGSPVRRSWLSVPRSRRCLSTRPPCPGSASGPR